MHVEYWLQLRELECESRQFYLLIELGPLVIKVAAISGENTRTCPQILSSHIAPGLMKDGQINPLPPSPLHCREETKNKQDRGHLDSLLRVLTHS